MLIVEKPHPSPFFDTSCPRPKSSNGDPFQSRSCNVIKLHRWGWVYTEFGEASKYYQVWIEEGFQQIFEVFVESFPWSVPVRCILITDTVPGKCNLFTGTVSVRCILFADTVSVRCILFADTVSGRCILYTDTVSVNNLFLIGKLLLTGFTNFSISGYNPL